MRVSGAALGVVAAGLFAALSSSSLAQDESRQRAPIVRVYSQSGLVASRYVTPAIEVSEDAYVFAVEMDLDGQIQILNPAFPGISVRLASHRQLRLPNFFAGFAQGGSRYDASGNYVSYGDSYVGAADDTRGSVIALASRSPFNLDRVESNGDWNIATIRRLIENRAPMAAAQALSAYIGARGESIGIDYMRFASAQYNDYYASTPLYSCDAYYGGVSSDIAFSRLAVLNRVARLRRAGQSVAILGYDSCGLPIVAYGPSQGYPRNRPHVPRDSGDTARGRSNFPRGRSAQAGRSEPREAAIGIFPATFGAIPQAGGDVLTPQSPSGRDPRAIFNDPRYDRLVRESTERGRASAERNAPPAEPPVIGTLPPAREYPRPIVREAPVMAHAPAPSPPPPRTAPEVHMKPTADHVPPPAR